MARKKRRGIGSKEKLRKAEAFEKRTAANTRARTAKVSRGTMPRPPAPKVMGTQVSMSAPIENPVQARKAKNLKALKSMAGQVKAKVASVDAAAAAGKANASAGAKPFGRREYPNRKSLSRSAMNQGNATRVGNARIAPGKIPNIPGKQGTSLRAPQPFSQSVTPSSYKRDNIKINRKPGTLNQPIPNPKTGSYAAKPTGGPRPTAQPATPKPTVASKPAATSGLYADKQAGQAARHAAGKTPVGASGLYADKQAGQALRRQAAKQTATRAAGSRLAGAAAARGAAQVGGKLLGPWGMAATAAGTAGAYAINKNTDRRLAENYEAMGQSLTGNYNRGPVDAPEGYVDPIMRDLAALEPLPANQQAIWDASKLDRGPGIWDPRASAAAAPPAGHPNPSTGVQLAPDRNQYAAQPDVQQDMHVKRYNNQIMDQMKNSNDPVQRQMWEKMRGSYGAGNMSLVNRQLDYAKRYMDLEAPVPASLTSQQGSLQNTVAQRRAERQQRYENMPGGNSSLYDPNDPAQAGAPAPQLPGVRSDEDIAMLTGISPEQAAMNRNRGNSLGNGVTTLSEDQRGRGGAGFDVGRATDRYNIDRMEGQPAGLTTSSGRKYERRINPDTGRAGVHLVGGADQPEMRKGTSIRDQATTEGRAAKEKWDAHVERKRARLEKQGVMRTTRAQYKRQMGDHLATPVYSDDGTLDQVGSAAMRTQMMGPQVRQERYNPMTGEVERTYTDPNTTTNVALGNESALGGDSIERQKFLWQQQQAEQAARWRHEDTVRADEDRRATEEHRRSVLDGDLAYKNRMAGIEEKKIAADSEGEGGGGSPLGTETEASAALKESIRGGGEEAVDTASAIVRSGVSAKEMKERLRKAGYTEQRIVDEAIKSYFGDVTDPSNLSPEDRVLYQEMQQAREFMGWEPTTQDDTGDRGRGEYKWTPAPKYRPLTGDRKRNWYDMVLPFGG